MSQGRVTRQKTKAKTHATNAAGINKAGKTHLPHADTDGDEDEAPAWAKCLFFAFESNQESLNNKLEEINSAIKTLSKDCKALMNRVSNVEKRISVLEDDSQKGSEQVKELSKQVSFLRNRIDDLESRSRSNNIRLVGLKEGAEAEDLNELLGRIFRYILNLRESDPIPEIDRAHRALRPRPNAEDPPRYILVRLLRWGDRQRILSAIGKKKSLLWDSHPFYIRQDLSAEVRRQRAEYNELIEDLKEKNLKFGMLHPARLIVTIDGEKLIYNSPEKARKDLQRRIQIGTVAI